MTTPDLISYRHKDDRQNKTRFVQRKMDKVPEWAADVQPYAEPSMTDPICDHCGMDPAAIREAALRDVLDILESHGAAGEAIADEVLALIPTKGAAE